MKTIDLVIERLLPGQDLKNEILRLVREHQILAGVVLSSVGSLSQACLRMANENHSQTWSASFEIINLNGTLSTDGVHLHLSVSDAKGQVFGGHLLEGCKIRTTCELVLMKLSGVRFSRCPDAITNYSELVVETEK